jgi:phycoerythrobilin:ferredoxin oxidoreductase
LKKPFEKGEEGSKHDNPDSNNLDTDVGTGMDTDTPQHDAKMATAVKSSSQPPGSSPAAVKPASSTSTLFTMGKVRHLETDHPKLEIELPTGQLLVFRGTKVSTTSRYLVLSCKTSGVVNCRNVFQEMVIFGDHSVQGHVDEDEVKEQQQQQQSLFLSETVKPVPTDLQYNSTPARGMPDGSQVKIELKSASATSSEGSPIRLARYALLETLTPSLVGVDDNVDDDDTSSVDSVAQQQSDMDVMNKSAPMISIPQAIHVLNLVVFPKTSLSLPVLGMDLVTLPGGKHLIAIDFQPVLPPPVPTSASSSSPNDNNINSNINNMDNEHVNDTVPTCGILFGPKFQKYETQLKELHQKFVLEERHIMPWGGDIPPQALRFFSPYALWTRLQDGKTEDGGKGSALEIIDHQVYQAFCAYLDLYLDMMQEVQEDLGQGNIQDDDAEDGAAIRQGHVDYLNYRKANDPARPMLTRLYGEEYTEKAISEVLFEMI